MTHLRRTSPIIISGKNIFNDLKKYFEKHLTKITLSYLHEGLNKNDVFDFTSEMSIHFGVNSYTFTQTDGKIIYEKSYLENLTQNEIKNLLKIISNNHKEYIEEKIVELENQ